MSLLDDDLELVPGKDILAEMCLKYFIEYGEHGNKNEQTSLYWTKRWNESILTIKTLYKNKHKHYKEIADNPKKYILCIHRCLHNGKFEYRLKIMDEDDLFKNNSVSPCWEDFYAKNNHSYMTIDKILNKVL